LLLYELCRYVHVKWTDHFSRKAENVDVLSWDGLTLKRNQGTADEKSIGQKKTGRNNEVRPTPHRERAGE